MNQASSTAIDQAAEQLVQAWQDKTPVPPLRESIADISSAYAVQSQFIASRVAAGAQVAGAKIGLTAPSVQRQFGVYQPDFGRLLDTMFFSSEESLSLADFIAPKVEGEIAFVLGQDLDQDRPNAAQVIQATEFVLPAMEIVDSRIRNWDLSIVDTVADNASSGAVVLGTTPYSLNGVDLAEVGMVLERNGDPVSFGAGYACLGSPVVAITWLARELASRGEPLRAGHVIMTGALGPMVSLGEHGGTFRLALSGLSDVVIHVQSNTESKERKSDER